MRALLILLMFLMVIGCGQKGALIEPEAPPIEQPAQVDEEDEDDEDDEDPDA